MRKNKDQSNKPKIKYILIVCEGEKTEPNYFKSFAKDNKNVFVNPVGTGFNTISLVDNAINKRNSGFSKDIPYDEAYVVFDKDSFNAADFNDAISKTERNWMRPIWSNEAFELWYVLHYKYDESIHNRGQYNTYLSTQIEGGYHKNMPEIRSILKDKERTAIKNAEKLYKRSKQNFGNNYSQQNPCTMVFRLVKRLKKLEQ